MKKRKQNRDVSKVIPKLLKYVWLWSTRKYYSQVTFHIFKFVFCYKALTPANSHFLRNRNNLHLYCTGNICNVDASTIILSCFFIQPHKRLAKTSWIQVQRYLLSIDLFCYVYFYYVIKIMIQLIEVYLLNNQCFKSIDLFRYHVGFLLCDKNHDSTYWSMYWSIDVSKCVLCLWLLLCKYGLLKALSPW